MSVLTAALIAGGFTALWLVANELEDPFGVDHNDLPMLQYHETYCGGIRSLLRWLDEDTWVCAKGPWSAPRGNSDGWMRRSCSYSPEHDESTAARVARNTEQGIAVAQQEGDAPREQDRAIRLSL